MNAEITELRDSARKVLGEAGLAAGEDKTWPLVLELGWLLVAVPEVTVQPLVQSVLSTFMFSGMPPLLRTAQV